MHLGHDLRYPTEKPDESTTETYHPGSSSDTPTYGEDIRRMMYGRHEVRLARRDGSEAAIIRTNLSAMNHSAVNYSAKNNPA